MSDSSDSNDYVPIDWYSKNVSNSSELSRHRPVTTNDSFASTSSVSSVRGNKERYLKEQEIPAPPPQDALIEIEQFELKTVPKTALDRLNQRLSNVNELTFYPGAEIDTGSTPIITDLKNEEDELILRLEHKSNVVSNEPVGIGKDKIKELFQEELSVKSGGTESRAVDSRYMKYCDENGRLVFRSICEDKYTIVKCGSGVLGIIDGTAMELLTTPNVVAKNEDNEILFEIAINDKDTLKPPRPQDEVHILSHGKVIGTMGRGVTHKGSCFGVTFPRDLDEEIKAVLITAVFLVYSTRKKEFQGLQAAAAVVTTTRSKISDGRTSNTIASRGEECSVEVGNVERNTNTKCNVNFMKYANYVMLITVLILTAAGSAKFFIGL